MAYYLLKHKDADKGTRCGPTWERKKQVKDHQHTDASRQTLQAKLDGLLDGIMSNAFEANPDRKSDLCQGCAYNFICPESLT